MRDGTGSLRVAWLNQRVPARRVRARPARRAVRHGRDARHGGLQLTNPQYEILDDEDGETIHTGRIVPVYEKTGSVTPKMQRRLVHDALQRLPAGLPDPLPEAVRVRLGLPSRHAALLAAHFPPADAVDRRAEPFATPAQRRLIFEEASCSRSGVLARRRAAATRAASRVAVRGGRSRSASRRARVLPFKLTAGQKQALKEIVDDLQRPQPMNRLLQGDVGAGKTIVALLAALVAMENGLQVAFMAPTEILAEQHFANISRLLQRVALPRRAAHRAARRRAARRDAARASSRAGPCTSSSARTRWCRATSPSRRSGSSSSTSSTGSACCSARRCAEGLHPDVLVMTATPIPRTLALTALRRPRRVGDPRPAAGPRADQDHGASPESRRDEVYAFVREQLDAGRQAYVIYPLVEESDKVDLRAATEMADHLAQEVFPEYRVGLLHGRMKADAKDARDEAFAAGELEVLVSTTVVEVGVDVPNASVMLVEHAERFGLSQLHQLRGRVGRDRTSRYCFLLYQSPLSDEARDALARR